jgi:hypothetical protein
MPTSERHHVGWRHLFFGRRSATGEQMVAVQEHFAKVADIEHLAAEGTALKMVAGASAEEIAFPPSSYHLHHRGPLMATLEVCRFHETPLPAHDD